MNPVDSPAVDPAALLHQAHTLLGGGARAEARALLESAIEAFPDDPGLLRACGTVWASDGDVAAAAGLFGHLVALHPGDGPAWVSWATTVAGTGDRRQLDDAVATLAHRDPPSARAWYSFGLALIQHGEWGHGQRLLEQGRRLDPQDLDIARALVNVLARLGTDGVAPSLPILQQLAASPDATAEDWVSLGRALWRIGEEDRMHRAFACAVIAASGPLASRLGIPTFPNAFLERSRVDEGARAAGASGALSRPIVIATLPKSGTEFLTDALSRGLGLGNLGLLFVNGIFPDVALSRMAVPRLLTLRTLCVSHCAPTRYNQIELSGRIDRMVVHVRDPRQAIVSWCHFLPRVIREADPIQAKHFGLPGGFASWAFDDQLAWLVEHHLRHWIRWVQGWHAASIDPEFRTRILFTRQEDLVEDQEAFFGRILEFYELDRAAFTLPEQPVAGKRNYRSGETAEWRRVLTPAQQAQAASWMTPALCEAFGWPVN